MGDVKLLGPWHCPFRYRVSLALKLKGVPFDVIEEDEWKKNPFSLESTPIIPIFKKDTPAIVHGGELIASGSLVDLEYVDDAFGGYPIFPKDPKAKAYARQFAKFIDEKFMPTFRVACWSYGEEQQKSIELTKENLAILETEFATQLKGKKFFGGDAIGFLDIVATYFAFWTDIIQKVNRVSLINAEEHPTMVKWSREFVNVEIVKENVPEGEKITAMYQTVVDSLVAKRAANGAN